MWQQVIVYAIGVVAAVYIIVKVYRLVTRRADPCAGCGGCDLRAELLKAKAAKDKAGRGDLKDTRRRLYDKKRECRTDKGKGSASCGCGCGK